MPFQSSGLKIFKVSATGNDFLLVDLTTSAARTLWQNDFGQASRADWTRRWCDRHEGIGADGLVILESAPHPLDFVWDFYNSDGGSAEMCGNAARAVSLYFAQTYSRPQLTFGTRAGEVRSTVQIDARTVQVQLPPVAAQEWAQKAELSPHSFDFVRAGVPHAVHQVRDIKNRAQLRELALELKKEPRFQKEGVNVTFVRPLDGDKLESVTFERGVEDFTLACGTGAVAAAFSVLRGVEGRTMEVQVPGGTLSVVWKSGHPILGGPAKIIAAIQMIRPK